MTTPQYPTTLPGVSTFTLAPSAQVIVSGNDVGPQALRRRSRQPGATSQLSFRYSETDYATFISWWKTELLYGHRWFTIRIPSAAGIARHVVRFSEPYRATLLGHRFWSVSATIETRDRQFTEFVITLASALYPIPIVDELDSSATPNRGFTLNHPMDTLEAVADLFSGALTTTVVYLAYSNPAEPFDSAADILAGSLNTVVAYLAYSNPAESLDSFASIESGTLVAIVAYLAYTIPTESLDSSANLVSGALT